MRDKLMMLGLLMLLCVGFGFAYTVGDGNCDGAEYTYPVNISDYTSTYSNSDMNVTSLSNGIYLEGYNDTEDWYPEGLYIGVSKSNVPFNSSWEYASVDTSGIDWGQDKYSGYFVIAFCNTTAQDGHDIEVCYRYMWNIDTLLELEAGGNQLDLTPTGCRYWNKSEPYYFYYDSDPCEYSDRDFSELRVYAWAEYGTLESFSGTIDNISFGNGENRMTSYDCATPMTNLIEASGGYGNLTSGWHTVSGIYESYPNCDSFWEQRIQGCPSGASCSVRLIGSDGYAFAVSYFGSGANLTTWSSFRDGYHNLTLRFFYDGTLLRFYDVNVNSDNGLVNGIPAIMMPDYSDLQDYRPDDDVNFYYLNIITRMTIAGYPYHTYGGSVTRCRENLAYTFDGVAMPYSFCRFMVDYTPVSPELVYWSAYVNGDYGTTGDQFYNKTIIGNTFSQYFKTMLTPNPPDYADSSTFACFDVVGDSICGDFESDNPYEWNYAPECRFGGVTGYASAVGTQTLQVMVLIFLALFVISAGVFPILKGELTFGEILTSVLAITFGIAMIVFGYAVVITP